MQKQKSWIWWLTVFANPNTTSTIYPNIYLSKNFYNFSKETQNRIIKHEQIHLEQQKNNLIKYLFLYIFTFPLFYNPWRYNWEYEAYTKSGTSIKKTKEYLSSWNYGFIFCSATTKSKQE